MIKVEFHGAAGTVTGSNYLVTTDKTSFVIDCGMFQGQEVERRNLEQFGYNASKVEFALLTHSHIDHSGMLPKLYKEGFRGQIYATNHTIQITSLLLLDSAKIQESNYQKGETYGKYTDVVGISYNTEHAQNTIGKFHSVEFKETFSPSEGIQVTYIHAGHILGAASIEIKITENGKETVLLFSGDLGRFEQPLIEPYDRTYHSTPDYVFMESLYGGIEHPERKESVNDLISIINKTIDNGGSVFIPSFAVQRTQEILHDMKTARAKGEMRTDIPVWLDSPLAQRVSKVYTEALQDTPDSLFYFENLRYVQKYRQSQKISKKPGQVIVAGSGMADGGRIVEHLSSGLENSKNTVIFVGYQAEGTLGRQLTEGAKSIQIGKSNIRVNAKIHHLHGFSAHGDTSDYVEWVRRFNTDKLKNLFLIHAEPERAEALKPILVKEGFKNISIPEWKQVVELS